MLFGKNLPHNHLSHRSDDQRDKQVLYGLQFSNNLFRDFRECEKVSKLFQMAKYGIYFPNVSQEVKDKIVAIEKSRPLTRLIYLLEVINALVEEEHYETLSSISFDEHKDLKKQHSRINLVLCVFFFFFERKNFDIFKKLMTFCYVQILKKIFT